jgi:hypothetical protein
VSPAVGDDQRQLAAWATLEGLYPLDLDQRLGDAERPEAGLH